MCKLIKKAVCIIIIAWLLFAAIAVWGGGDKFRWIGDKAGGVVEKWSHSLAEKADSFQKQSEVYKKKIQKWLDRQGQTDIDDKKPAKEK